MTVSLNLGNDDIPLASDLEISKEFDPTYGPQLPRIARSRIINTYDREDLATIGYYYVGSSGARFEQPLSLGHYTLLRRSLCEDTIRNKNYQGDRSLLSDDGGELVIRKSWWNRRSVNFFGVNPSGYFFDGDVGLAWAARSFDGLPHGDLPPDEDVNEIVGFGAEAWRKFKPAQPQLSLGVFIAELRDTPSLLHASLSNLKHISDYFLAVQFGWKPLLADILRMINFVDRVSKQLDFLKANAGKPVRRSGTVYYNAESGYLEHPGELQMWNVSGGGYNNLPYNPSAVMSSERWTVSRQIKFSGEFIFYMTDLRFPENRRRTLAKLAGGVPSPADLWDALPWTWLIDWFSNVSDVVHNLTDSVADRQVSKYAYIMGETSRMYEQTSTEGNLHPSLSRNYVTKVRKKVDPFGLDAGGELTPLKIAILAALGISLLL